MRIITGRGAVAAGVVMVVAWSAASPASGSALTGRIVFADSRYPDNWDISVVNPDGSGRHRLTFGGAIEMTPRWSPDGHWIAYSSGVFTYGIKLMQADGRNKRTLVPAEGKYHFDPAWSPDGRWIAYEQSTLFGPGEIWKIDVDSGARFNLSRGTRSDDRAPGWSPDGSRIAFVRNDEIWTMNADGGDLRQVTEGEDQPFAPDWSPDGRQLAYSVNGSNYDRLIFSIEPGGSQRSQVTDPNDWDDDPTWSPDGDWIAYDSMDSNDETSSIEAVKPDGGTTVGIANFGLEPDWGPTD